VLTFQTLIEIKMTKFMKWSDSAIIPNKQKVYAIVGEFMREHGPTYKHRVIFDSKGNVFCIFKTLHLSKSSHPIWLACQCFQEDKAWLL
jgi:hypothetical protein